MRDDELAEDLAKANVWAAARGKPRLAELMARASAAAQRSSDLADTLDQAVREREALRRWGGRRVDALVAPSEALLDHLHSLWGWDHRKIHRLLTEVETWCQALDPVEPKRLGEHPRETTRATDTADGGDEGLADAG